MSKWTREAFWWTPTLKEVARKRTITKQLLLVPCYSRYHWAEGATIITRIFKLIIIIPTSISYFIYSRENLLSLWSSTSACSSSTYVIIDHWVWIVISVVAVVVLIEIVVVIHKLLHYQRQKHTHLAHTTTTITTTTIDSNHNQFPPRHRHNKIQAYHQVATSTTKTTTPTRWQRWRDTQNISNKLLKRNFISTNETTTKPKRQASSNQSRSLKRPAWLVREWH